MLTTFPAAAEQQLRADGFRPGAPAHLSQGCYAIDLACCRESVCGQCHHRGLTFRPFHQEDGPRYRALAVCPACNFTEEF